MPPLHLHRFISRQAARTLAGWKLLVLCASAFSPSRGFHGHLLNFVRKSYQGMRVLYKLTYTVSLAIYIFVCHPCSLVHLYVTSSLVFLFPFALLIFYF